MKNAVLTCLAVLWSSAAAGSELEFGVGLDLTSDIGDAGLDQGAADLGMGLALRGPVRWVPHPLVSIRADPFFSFNRGQDRVEWSQFGGAVSYASEDHWTMLTQLGVMVGPEISPWSVAKLAPYAGSTIGLSWARHWHSFKGPSAVLLDPSTNDVQSGGNIDPYTDQLAPSVGLHAGVRIHDWLPFAFEAELGYNVAFMRRARLKNARPALSAHRTAYGFNPLRLGVNLVFVR